MDGLQFTWFGFYLARKLVVFGCSWATKSKPVKLETRWAFVESPQLSVPKNRIFIYETIYLKACTGGRVRFAKDVVEDPDSEEPEKEEFANRMWNRNENCSCGCEDCEAKGLVKMNKPGVTRLVDFWKFLVKFFSLKLPKWDFGLLWKRSLLNSICCAYLW